MEAGGPRSGQMQPVRRVQAPPSGMRQLRLLQGQGNRQEGLRLQEEFVAEFRKAYREKDHCPCQKACRYHGNCKECVAIHRAHQEHVPNCMRPILNSKIKVLSELTEHTIANEIEPPHEILRKEFRNVTD